VIRQMHLEEESDPDQVINPNVHFNGFFWVLGLSIFSLFALTLIIVAGIF
jgi:hypothetical protein